MTAILNDNASLATWTYGVAAAGFAAFAATLWRSSLGRHGRVMLIAVALSALWTLAAAFHAARGHAQWLTIANVCDILRLGAWFVFLAALLLASRRANGEVAAQASRWSWLVIGFLVVGALVLQVFPAVAGSRLVYGSLLVLAVAGLMLVEQVFRNVSADARWGVKHLCLGLAATFCFDLYTYADAFLFNRLEPDLWAARGIANFLIVPLIAISTVRNKDWKLQIAMSRQIVLHSTTMLASGMYLLAIAGAGYYVRYFGGSWGGTLQTLLLFAGLLTLCLLFFSGTLRAKWRVLLSKHFFRYRYDYRAEWLRFTQALTAAGPELGVVERAIKALADLVESPGGALWLADASGHFRQSACWNMPESNEVETCEGALASFLAGTGWVIDIAEYRNAPAKYDSVSLPEWLTRFPDVWLVVPLCADTELVGFVLLATPRVKFALDWEVLDLLKTAARQAASYLAHMRAVEALLEAKKFDSFNRMSAFVVHDLKNLVAQLSLVLKNAEKHKHKPEFQADMLMTIDNVVERMKQLLLQLRAGTTPIEKPRPVDLEPIIGRIQRAKAGHRPTLSIDMGASVEVIGHADRLERVIGHLVENALDATPETGRVWLKLKRYDDRAIVEVGDTGRGMSQQFIRERLFKPFHSTKEAGMGIGAYESSQYIGELGGKIVVDSKENVGTVVRIELPAALPAVPAAALKEVA